MKKTSPTQSPPSKANPITRLTISAMSIVHLHEIGELTESQAKTLMHCRDIVSYRTLREQLTKEMKDAIAKDMERNGWKFQ
jgi:hypothetical protein